MVLSGACTSGYASSARQTGSSRNRVRQSESGGNPHQQGHLGLRRPLIGGLKRGLLRPAALDAEQHSKHIKQQQSEQQQYRPAARRIVKQACQVMLPLGLDD